MDRGWQTNGGGGGGLETRAGQAVGSAAERMMRSFGQTLPQPQTQASCHTRASSASSRLQVWTVSRSPDPEGEDLLTASGLLPCRTAVVRWKNRHSWPGLLLQKRCPKGRRGTGAGQTPAATGAPAGTPGAKFLKQGAPLAALGGKKGGCREGRGV